MKEGVGGSRTELAYTPIPLLGLLSVYFDSAFVFNFFF